MLTNGEGEGEGDGEGDGDGDGDGEGSTGGNENIEDKKDARRAATTGSGNTERKQARSKRQQQK
ncbi:hypothetical protein E4U12_003927, partial [Claviceps purpurea]